MQGQPDAWVPLERLQERVVGLTERLVKDEVEIAHRLMAVDRHQQVDGGGSHQTSDAWPLLTEAWGGRAAAPGRFAFCAGGARPIPVESPTISRASLSELWRT